MADATPSGTRKKQRDQRDQDRSDEQRNDSIPVLPETCRTHSRPKRKGTDRAIPRDHPSGDQVRSFSEAAGKSREIFRASAFSIVRKPSARWVGQRRRLGEQSVKSLPSSPCQCDSGNWPNLRGALSGRRCGRPPLGWSGLAGRRSCCQSLPVVLIALRDQLRRAHKAIPSRRLRPVRQIGDDAM